MTCYGVNLEYFEEQLNDELEGACCYAKLAIETRAMSVTWGKMFIEMSVEELDHANHLFKMFEEYCELISKPYDETPEYISKAHEKVVDMYTKKSAKVRYMHDMYSR